MELKQYFTNHLQNIIARFQETFGHPLETKPTLPTLNRFVLRKSWGTLEECIEQIRALSDNEEEFKKAIQMLQDGFNKAVEKQSTKEFITDETEKLTALADGLADELWFLLGDCVEVGIDIQPIIEIIDASNQSKLFEDENGNLYPKQNEDGKIIKSPLFFAPEENIKKDILRQLEL